MRTLRRLPLRLIAALVLAMAVMMVYVPGLNGGFIFDDFPNLVHESSWKIDRLTLENLSEVAEGGISSSVGRPLALISFALNYRLTGANPYWLKLTSLFLHLFNGIMVFVLCRQLLQALPNGPRPDRPLLTATILMLTWLLHPLQVSTVLYVVQRMEVAAATCTLLALVSYVAGRARQINAYLAWPWFAGAAVAAVLGLGFKESALLIPGFALLIEIFLLRFSGAPSGARHNGWLAFYLIAVGVAAATWLYVVLPVPSLAASYAARDFGPGERFLTQAPVLAMYLKQIVLPLPDSMWFYYDNFPVSRSLIEPRTLLSVSLLLALTSCAAIYRRRLPLSAFGIAWFFVAHALTSNLVPLELAFEHRNYLALLGILLALIQPICLLGQKLHADARTVLSILPVAALGVLCWIQASTWGDPTRLAWTLENRNPQSVRASYSLGKQLLTNSGGHPSAPEWAMALRQFEHASQLPGQRALPLQGQILMLAQAGHEIPNKVWDEFRKALIKQGRYAERIASLHAVSQCRINRACVLDDDQLLQTFLHMLEHYPRDTSLLTMYANFAWNVLGDAPLAINVQQRAVEYAPHSPTMRQALASFLSASAEEATKREAPGSESSGSAETSSATAE